MNNPEAAQQEAKTSLTHEQVRALIELVDSPVPDYVSDNEAWIAFSTNLLSADPDDLAYAEWLVTLLLHSWSQSRFYSRLIIYGQILYIVRTLPQVAKTVAIWDAYYAPEGGLSGWYESYGSNGTTGPVGLRQAA